MLLRRQQQGACYGRGNDEGYAVAAATTRGMLLLQQ
jgi:hypothetical protein